MKSRTVWSGAALVIALSPLCIAHANSLEDLIAYNFGPPHSYTYTVTVQDAGAAGQAARVTAPQAPVVSQQSVAPRPAYQQPIQQPRTNPARRSLSNASPGTQTVRSAAVNGLPSLGARPANPGAQGPSVRPHQPNYPAQPYPAAQRGYGQVPQVGYYTSPYQTRYTAAPNYYQGYWYNAWDSSPQACPPGRA